MNDLAEKAKLIKLVILDVDGVLTNGQLLYSEHGEFIKIFNVRDGLGIKLLQKAHIKVAIISSRHSLMVQRRMQELGIELIFQGQTNKLTAYENLLLTLGLVDEEVACIGDDLPELPLLIKAGLGIAVKDAHSSLINAADWVTQNKGGKGAVREVADFILNSQGKMEEIMEFFS